MIGEFLLKTNLLWKYNVTRNFIIFGRGHYFGPKNDIYFHPPPLKIIFYPSCDTSFFDSYCDLFVLILPYFAFILPSCFAFSHFISPFFLFILHFLPFSLPLFIFFPQMTLADISCGGGGGIIQYMALIFSEI
jgi:hypothetical protein